MFRTSPHGIYLLTDVGDVLCASGPCACLLGDQREEVKGRSALDFIRSDAHEPSRDALRMALAARGACARIQVRDEETGFMVDDVQGAVECLSRISVIDERACRARVEQHFSVQSMVEGYERVYQTIFRQRHPGIPASEETGGAT